MLLLLRKVKHNLSPIDTIKPKNKEEKENKRNMQDKRPKPMRFLVIWCFSDRKLFINKFQLKAVESLKKENRRSNESIILLFVAYNSLYKKDRADQAPFQYLQKRFHVPISFICLCMLLKLLLLQHISKIKTFLSVVTNCSVNKSNFNTLNNIS